MQKPSNLTQIQTIYWIIFTMLLAMLGVSIMVLSKFGVVWDFSLSDKETYKTIIVLLALFGIPAGFAFHKKHLSRIPAELPLEDRLKAYKSSFFIMIVTLEALAIIALTGYMFSSDVVFLIIFGLLFVVYLLNIPARSRVMRELEPEEGNDTY